MATPILALSCLIRGGDQSSHAPNGALMKQDDCQIAATRIVILRRLAVRQLERIDRLKAAGFSTANAEQTLLVLVRLLRLEQRNRDHGRHPDDAGAALRCASPPLVPERSIAGRRIRRRPADHHRGHGCRAAEEGEPSNAGRRRYGWNGGNGLLIAQFILESKKGPGTLGPFENLTYKPFDSTCSDRRCRRSAATTDRPAD